MHSYLKIFFNSFPFLPSKWTERGCKVKLSDLQKTVCLCNHLTNFAILMRPYSTVRTVILCILTSKRHDRTPPPPPSKFYFAYINV